MAKKKAAKPASPKADRSSKKFDFVVEVYEPGDKNVGIQEFHNFVNVSITIDLEKEYMDSDVPYRIAEGMKYNLNEAFEALKVFTADEWKAEEKKREKEGREVFEAESKYYSMEEMDGRKKGRPCSK